MTPCDFQGSVLKGDVTSRGLPLSLGTLSYTIQPPCCEEHQAALCCLCQQSQLRSQRRAGVNHQTSEGGSLQAISASRPR